MSITSIAKELATFTQASMAGDEVDALAVWDAFERMVTTEARTTKDALALLVNARKVLNSNLMPPDSYEGYSQYCALLLIRNAILALEKVTGEQEATYAGHDWH